MTTEAYVSSNGVDPLGLSLRTVSGTDDDRGDPAPETESDSGVDLVGPFPSMVHDSESDLSLWRFRTSDAVPEMLVAALRLVACHMAGLQ